MTQDNSFSGLAAAEAYSDARLADLTHVAGDLIQAAAIEKIASLLPAATKDGRGILIERQGRPRTIALDPNNLANHDADLRGNPLAVVGSEQWFVATLEDGTELHLVARVPNEVLESDTVDVLADLDDVSSKVRVLAYNEHNLYGQYLELRTPREFVRVATNVRAQADALAQLEAEAAARQANREPRLSPIGRMFAGFLRDRS